MRKVVKLQAVKLGREGSDDGRIVLTGVEGAVPEGPPSGERKTKLSGWSAYGAMCAARGPAGERATGPF
jgi:hypothetical protein